MTTILVIEDERVLRDDIADMLAFEGYTVIRTCNGMEGLQAAHQQPPDLIICDVGMPELGGYDVLTALRANRETKTTPFIFLTAMADRSFMRHGMELGANDYLTKPFTRSELFAAVRAQIEHREAHESTAQEEQERARRTLMRTITHELRSPLAGMNLAQQLIERQLDHLSKGDLRELLRTLRTGSRRLQNVVEQILLATQLEAQSLSRDSVQNDGDYAEPGELLSVAVNHARTFAYRNQNADIHINTYGQNTLVFGVVKVLVHAFAEIIANAINFSPSGKPIAIALWQSDGMIWASVTDQGPGIPQEKLDRALRPFEQIDRETQEQQGLGLGLSLAYRIVEVHSGSLEINTTAGKGTEVLIGLPYYQTDEDAFPT